MWSMSAHGLRGRFAIITTALLCLGFSSLSQAPQIAFAVASIKPSSRILGKDRPPSRYRVICDVASKNGPFAKSLLLR